MGITMCDPTILGASSVRSTGSHIQKSVDLKESLSMTLDAGAPERDGRSQVPIIPDFAPLIRDARGNGAAPAKE